MDPVKPSFNTTQALKGRLLSIPQRHKQQFLGFTETKKREDRVLEVLVVKGFVEREEEGEVGLGKMLAGIEIRVLKLWERRVFVGFLRGREKNKLLLFLGFLKGKQSFCIPSSPSSSPL